LISLPNSFLEQISSSLWSAISFCNVTRKLTDKTFFSSFSTPFLLYLLFTTLVLPNSVIFIVPSLSHFSSFSSASADRSVSITPSASDSSFSSSRHNMNFSIAWKTSIDDLVSGEPFAVDLDADGTLEVLVASRELTTRANDFYCFSHNGTLEWSLSFEDYITATSFADFDGDGFIELIVNVLNFGGSNALYSLSHDGTINWFVSFDDFVGLSSQELAIADLDADGTFELLLVANGLLCLSHDGSLDWYFSLEASDKGLYSSPAIADLDGDGSLEVLFGYEDHFVYCLSHTGELLWSFEAGDAVMSTPSFGDLDADGTLEVVVGSDDHYLYCLSHDGTLEWSFKATGPIWTPPIIADSNNDGSFEIIFSAYFLYCLTANGTLMWSKSGHYGHPKAPAVADFNNDGFLEIVVGADSFVYIYTFNGTRIWSDCLLNYGVRSPVIADLDADGILEIVFTSVGSSLSAPIVCLEVTGVDRSGAGQWPCFHGSPFHTGQPDSDSDFLDDLTEHHYNTDPLIADADLDGYVDGREVFSRTDPHKADTDADGLLDGEEVFLYFTDPLDKDSDNDFRSDGKEIAKGSNPLQWDNWSLVFGVFLLPVYALVLIPLYFIIKKYRFEH
jgi:hypothetical protein